MPRETFDRNLLTLKENVLSLGNTVEEHLAVCVNVFIQGNMERAQQLVDSDVEVNQKRIEIVIECLSLIATQQPTASDFRSLAANIEISSELERIHDYIKGVGKRTLEETEKPISVEIQQVLTKMASCTQAMLQDALHAYDAVDNEKARDIPRADLEVDKLFKEGSHLLAISVTDDDSTYQKYYTQQQVLNYLERIGDRVTNICEWIIYRGTGNYHEIN